MKYQMRKAEKDRENIAKQAAQEETGLMGKRRGSYTLTSPIFASEMLPKISVESSESDMETVIDGPLSLLSIESEIDENATDKSSKDLRNEIDKISTPTPSLYDSVIEPQVNNQLKDLIEKQKLEYLRAMEALKSKFTSEQQDLMTCLQSNLVPITSTPLNNNSILTCATDDEDFTEFKTCLQSQSQSQESIDEKTIVNDHDAKVIRFNLYMVHYSHLDYFQIKAVTTINAYSRGFLIRRLMKTIYVQEHIRNIRETLQLVLSLDERHITGSPVQNILLKAKLFRQLQSDLYNFNEIFFLYSSKERMKIIAADRDIRMKKQAEENESHLSLSFTGLV